MSDCISRQAVIDTLDRMDKALDEDRTVEMYRDLLKECYTVLPSVNPQKTQMIDKSNFDQEQYKADLQCAYDCGKASVNPQEPKTGHWVRISMDKYTQHAKYYYKCSECKEEIIGEHNYCPNCGCRMFEPQESEVQE